MLGLRHVALRVGDIRKSLDFYTRVLKLKVEWHPDPDNVYLTSGTDNLALHQVGGDSVAGRPRGDRSGPFRFSGGHSGRSRSVGGPAPARRS